MVTKTLTAMAKGGIFDQIGGGFSRYSTDEKWLKPHFEKMLYDNALLLLTYSETYERTHETLYRDVAQRTADYLLRKRRLPQVRCGSARPDRKIKKESLAALFFSDCQKTSLRTKAVVKTEKQGELEGDKARLESNSSTKTAVFSRFSHFAEGKMLCFFSLSKKPVAFLTS